MAPVYFRHLQCEFTDGSELRKESWRSDGENILKKRWHTDRADVNADVSLANFNSTTWSKYKQW